MITKTQSEVIRLSISGHHECPEMDTLFYAVADYQRAQKFLTPPCLKCHDGVRTICDSHRFLTRDIFLRKNSQKVCLLRKYSYLCGVVRHYVKLKNFRLWETQNSKKLKIVLNFQDCLVVSNFLSTFANEYET